MRRNEKKNLSWKAGFKRAGNLRVQIFGRQGLNRLIASKLRNLKIVDLGRQGIEKNHETELKTKRHKS